jgi:hypothetical protein
MDVKFPGKPLLVVIASSMPTSSKIAPQHLFISGVSVCSAGKKAYSHPSDAQHQKAGSDIAAVSPAAFIFQFVKHSLDGINVPDYAQSSANVRSLWGMDGVLSAT